MCGNYINWRKKCSDHLVREANLKLAIIEDVQTLASNLNNDNIYKILSMSTPEILHRLIDRINIIADGSPRIFYRFSNPAAYSLLLIINAQHSACMEHILLMRFKQR